MIPVLTLVELAEMLRLEPELVKRLAEETDLPRVVISGKTRFLSADVLVWLGRQDTPLLPRRAEPEAAAPQVAVRQALAPAGADEAAFVSREALGALGPEAAKPGDNLERLQVRDALMTLADALAAPLMRLSGGRLHPHPDEASRTSTWRAEECGGEALRSLRLAWADTARPTPGFTDRARLELELSSEHVSLTVAGPADVARPQDLEEAQRAGAEVAEGGGVEGWSVAMRHPLQQRPPTLTTAVARLTDDLRLLVPLWLAATGHEGR